MKQRKVRFINFLLYQFFHTFGKWTGIANRRPFADTGSKSDRIRSPNLEQAGSKNCPFPRAATAIGKAHQFNIIFIRECADFIFYCFEICSAGTVVLCLHTTNNTKFHIAPPLPLLCDQFFQFQYSPTKEACIVHSEILFAQTGEFFHATIQNFLQGNEGRNRDGVAEFDVNFIMTTY